MIHLRHVRMMLRLHIIRQTGIQRLKLRVRLDRIVRLVRPHRQKEGLRWIPFLLQPPNRLLHHQRRRIPLHQSHRLTIAHKIVRILMTRSRIVLRRQPPVIPVIPRLRLLRIIEQPVQMPLPNVARAIPRPLQQLRQRHLTRPQMHLRPLRNPSVNPISMRRPPCQKRRPRRTANRTPRVTLRQPHPLLRKRIQIRRLNHLMPKASQIPIPQIIRQKQNHIRCRNRRQNGSP